MDLSKPLPPPPSAYPNGALNSRRPTRSAPCQPSFNEPQYTLSASSDSSDPGMTEDPPSWSGSDTTVEEHQFAEAELWDSYFWPSDKDNLRSPFHQIDPRAGPSFCQESKLSTCNRNFASSNLSGLNVNECPAESHHSDAIRTPYRTPKLVPQNSYSPFPAVSPLLTQSYESTHKSWPLRCDSQSQPQRPPPRSRAHIISSDYKPLPPSNLSASSTLDDRNSPCHSSTSSASGLYMRSVPLSPDIAPQLIELMEHSYFDDSDNKESKLAALVTRLHIKSASSNSPHPCGKKEKSLRSQTSRKNLKSAGDAFKGMLGMRKSSGAV